MPVLPVKYHDKQDKNITIKKAQKNNMTKQNKHERPGFTKRYLMAICVYSKRWLNRIN